MNEIIRVRNLRKIFKIPIPCEKKGALARLRHFVTNPSRDFAAVENLSFTVRGGEILGFLGANGSGKSTTIKMLTGILTPTSGEVVSLGHVPWRERMAYTSKIGVVFGQKSLLWWNIPVIESFKLYRDIYDQSEKSFQRRVDQFSAILELKDFLHVPVRKLSLGLRMRAEIIASLLHEPRIIFLDEPTIGLDVRARLNLKKFLRRINEEMGINIFLTTHNMFDVEDLCQRCVIIDKGRKIYDGSVAALKAQEEHKVVEVEILEVKSEGALERILERGLVMERDAASAPSSKLKLRVPSAETVDVIDKLFACCRLANLNVLPPTLESVIEKVFGRQEGEGREGQEEEGRESDSRASERVKPFKRKRDQDDREASEIAA